MRNWVSSHNPVVTLSLSKGDSRIKTTYQLLTIAPLIRGFFYYFRKTISAMEIGAFIVFYFAGVILSIIVLDFAYKSYMRGLGLDWNPRREKIFGIKFRGRDPIQNIIDMYIDTHEFSADQIKKLERFKSWERWNTILFLLFPVLALLLLILQKKGLIS